MKVATLEKFHLRGGNQDPGDPGVGKVRGGGEDFFPSSRGGTDPWWHYANVCWKERNKAQIFWVFQAVSLGRRQRWPPVFSKEVIWTPSRTAAWMGHLDFKINTSDVFSTVW